MKIGIAYDTPEMYDFAFSFAGEDRRLVKSIKEMLEKQNYTVFYDNDLQYELVGKDLYSSLREIYKNKCKFVVCFISENYSKKVWTKLEFTAVKERLMSTFFASDFLIPILIDDSPLIKDIPSFIGFYRHKNLKTTVQLLIKKFDSSIIDDNYLLNIGNCIHFICNEVSCLLKRRGYSVTLFNNTISIKKHNFESCFKFLPENDMNIPSILVYYETSQYPELFISWSRNYMLKFNIHYLNRIATISQDLEIRQLIEILAEYISKCSE